MIPARQPSLSAAQQAFIKGAEALGATTPGSARGIADLPRLSSSELDELVQVGLVREAAEWRYYVFRPRTVAASSSTEPAAVAGARQSSPASARILKMIFFWILIALIPLLLVKLTAVH